MLSVLRQKEQNERLGGWVEMLHGIRGGPGDAVDNQVDGCMLEGTTQLGKGVYECCLDVGKHPGCLT